ncbi:hypothetical protein PC110_g2487 [Phytophthora cactorum]|uniref:DUF659 domain-containing protein n=1 Tax=Phytophthora cactorum TaxID=29920 RepID=A0A329SXY7_9STRA|nr:hypothetical protein PC117_g10977 [Phytophthora cactorum]RAW41321.1 hypothetical protein PC110_g2487 [Phytophthora cactorum]
MARAALGTALELRLRARAEHSDAAGSSAPVPRKIDTDTMLKRLLEFQADNCLPDSFIERPSTLRFIENINADAVDHLPARKTMGGPMLTKYAAEVTAEEDEHLALFGAVTTIGLFPTDSSHDGFTLARQLETIMIDAEDNGWNIGAVVTDDAGQCSRARRILALRWPNVVFLKCFAHDVNNLVKSILRSSAFRLVTSQAQKAVKTLNTSSAKWLKRAQEMMIQTYAVLRDLYEKFCGGLYSDELLKLVEARWAMYEQPRFMLALFLHPAYYKDAVKLPTTKVTGLENISDIAEYYCKKLLRCDSDTLVGEISDWLSGKFVKKEKTLDQFQKLFVATASCVLRSYAAYQANEHPTKASANCHGATHAQSRIAATLLTKLMTIGTALVAAASAAHYHRHTTERDGCLFAEAPDIDMGSSFSYIMILFMSGVSFGSTTNFCWIHTAVVTLFQR